MSTQTRFRQRRSLTLLCAAVASWILTSGLPTAAAPTLTDLNRVDELRTLFNQDRGTTRIVLLLSPT